MMTDKDKIIKAIKCRTERNNRWGNPCEETGNCHYAKCMVGLDGEPYYPFVCDTEQLCTDVLALLKEQEEQIERIKERPDDAQMSDEDMAKYVAKLRDSIKIDLTRGHCEHGR